MLIIFILLALFLKLSIYKNDYAKYILEILYKLGFDLIYLLITNLLRSNSLNNEKNYQVTLTLLANQEN